jgi:hypothetical protein
VGDAADPSRRLGELVALAGADIQPLLAAIDEHGREGRQADGSGESAPGRDQQGLAGAPLREGARAEAFVI